MFLVIVGRKMVSRLCGYARYCSALGHAGKGICGATGFGDHVGWQDGVTSDGGGFCSFLWRFSLYSLFL